eukprot:1343585-Amphidinium_carterae.1
MSLDFLTSRSATLSMFFMTCRPHLEKDPKAALHEPKNNLLCSHSTLAISLQSFRSACSGARITFLKNLISSSRQPALCDNGTHARTDQIHVYLATR